MSIFSCISTSHRGAPAHEVGTSGPIGPKEKYWCSSVLHHHQPIRTGFGAPGFAFASKHLAHRGTGLVAREALEAFALRIEAHDRVGSEVGEPDLVLPIDPHRIRLWFCAWQLPRAPCVARSSGLRIEGAHLPRQPLADPDPS